MEIRNLNLDSFRFSSPENYQTKTGDTLQSVAAQFGITPEALAKANGLDPNAPLSPGTQLTIPHATSAAAPSNGETLVQTPTAVESFHANPFDALLGQAQSSTGQSEGSNLPGQLSTEASASISHNFQPLDGKASLSVYGGVGVQYSLPVDFKFQGTVNGTPVSVEGNGSANIWATATAAGYIDVDLNAGSASAAGGAVAGAGVDAQGSVGLNFGGEQLGAVQGSIGGFVGVGAYGSVNASFADGKLTFNIAGGVALGVGVQASFGFSIDFGAIASAALQLGSNIADGVSAAAGTVADALSNAASTVGSAFSDAASAVGNAVSGAVEAVGGFFSDLGSAISSFFSSLFSSSSNEAAQQPATTTDSGQTSSSTPPSGNDTEGGGVEEDIDPNQVNFADYRNDPIARLAMQSLLTPNYGSPSMGGVVPGTVDPGENQTPMGTSDTPESKSTIRVDPTDLTAVGGGTYVSGRPTTGNVTDSGYGGSGATFSSGVGGLIEGQAGALAAKFLGDLSIIAGTGTGGGVPTPTVRPETLGLLGGSQPDTSASTGPDDPRP